MISFGKKIAALRKNKNLSQTELAKRLGTSISVISRYERDEINPSIEAAKKLTEVLGTTVGYLLGETENDQLFQDPKILERLQSINKLDEKEKQQVYFVIDAVIHELYNRRTYSLQN